MLFPIINQPSKWYSSNDHIVNQEEVDSIPERDRINFIRKCNKIENELNSIITNHLTKINREQYKILIEKKQYVHSIRSIVNDLSFTNRNQFKELYSVLKEIHIDTINQSKNIVDLEKTLTGDHEAKDQLVNMLVQRMMYDTSKRTLSNPKTFEILAIDKDENQRKLLEKYIIKVIKKQLKKEMNRCNVDAQDMNILENDQLKKKLDLIENTINKLGSMESLYEKIHSKDGDQRRRIITLVHTPVKKSIKPLKQCNRSKITKKIDLEKAFDDRNIPIIKIGRNSNPNPEYKANTIYVSE